jgi:ribosomal protein S1
MFAQIELTLSPPPAVLFQNDERLLMSHRRVNSMDTMQNYNLGDVVTGVVQSVKPYGAFLDIGGTMGLLHISQITHERLTTVEQVLQVSMGGSRRTCAQAGWQAGG